MILLSLLFACTAPSSDTASDSGVDDPRPECAEWEAPTVAGDVSDATLTEISGLAASRVHAGVLWAHEDSGARAEVTALSSTGEVLATVSLEGVTPFDWEDISAAPVGGTPSLIVADIGDNSAIRANVTLYVLPEPTTLTDSTVSATQLVLTYEDGGRDAEALWVDNEQVLVLTKRDSPARLYSAPLEDGAVLRLQGEIPFGEAPLVGGTPTAADLNADGDLLTVRSYTHAWSWRRLHGRSWPDVLLDDPCEVRVAEESQGEAITVDAAGDVFTVSENEPVLYRSLRSVQ